MNFTPGQTLLMLLTTQFSSSKFEVNTVATEKLPIDLTQVTSRLSYASIERRGEYLGVA